MFNFIAAALMTYLLVNVLIKPGQQSPEIARVRPERHPAGHATAAGKIGITFTATPLNLAFLLALAAGVLVWLSGLAHALGLRAARRWARTRRRPSTPASRRRA